MRRLVEFALGALVRVNDGAADWLAVRAMAMPNFPHLAALRAALDAHAKVTPIGYEWDDAA